MVGKVELDSTFPIIQTVCRRSLQTPETIFSICLRRGADLLTIVSPTDRRPLQIIWKPGFTEAYTGALPAVIARGQQLGNWGDAI